MPEILLEMKGITKEFPGVKALDNVNLTVEKGEIHALIGENGAGKSTLMNVLSGVYPYGTYTGEIIYKGEPCRFRNIKDSSRKKIVIIHQELALVPFLSIAENIFLGNEIAQAGVINWDACYKKAQMLLDKVGLNESCETLVKDIGIGKQQLVEIAKALAQDAELLILDEPTASLNDEDSDHLLSLLLSLKEEGLTSILISHKLNEIMKVADRITILRDGSTIETLDKAKDSVTTERIVAGMVGRPLVDYYPKREKHIGEVFFEVKNWNVYSELDPSRKIIDDVSFSIRRGEIVGIAGLMGAGRTELAMSIFGRSYGSKVSGTIIKDGREISLKNVRQAIHEGIVYATEDRKDSGLILSDDICHNISLASLERISSHAVINAEKEIAMTEEYVNKFGVKTSGVGQLAGNLSGGNQQKVVLGKCMMTEPDVLILDEPTRGIDVGAKYEIYCIINELVAQNKGVLMISSEMPELLGMADRIYVMNEGKMVGEFSAAEATQEKIMHCILTAKEHIA